MSEISCFSSEFILCLSLPFFFIMGLIIKRKMSYLEFVDFCFFNSIVIFLIILHRLLQISILQLFIQNNSFMINPFILSIQSACIILVIILLLGSYDYFRIKVLPVFEIICLLFINILGLFLLLKANNLFVLYLSIEIQSISLYILISFRTNSVYAIESALKYFIFSITLTLSFLYGISLIYSELGTVNFQDLHLILTENVNLYSFGIVEIGIYLIFCGLLLKLAIFPFHGWIADVYLGTNLISTSFIATIPKIAFIAILIKFLFVFSCLKFELGLLLGILGCCSIIIGTIVGLYQTKLLRILAFSAMVNMGHIILAISLQTVEGIVAGIYSIFIYCFIILGIFLILMSYRTEKWEIKNLTDLVELLKVNKLIVFIFATFIFSLAGLPPFAGFCGKFFIFLAVIKQGEYFYAFIIFIFSIVTAIYYLRFIRFLYFSEVDLVSINMQVCSKHVNLIIIVIFLINIGLWFFQAPLVLFLTNLIIENFFLGK